MVSRAEILAMIEEFCLMDDDFMSEVFDDSPEVTALLLNILLERTDMKVLKTETQVEYKSAAQRSVKLDVRAEDETGKIYDIEIQRSDRGSGVRRARVHSSMIDRTLLEKSQDFETIVDTYVIFITENDKFGLGLPLYHIERTIREKNHEAFGDGTHIIYVNGKYRNPTHPVGRLMHDFHCKRADDMYYSTLAERVRYYKEDGGGSPQMCRLVEEMMDKVRLESRQEGRAEGRAEGRVEGRAEGRAEGILQGQAEGLLLGRQEERKKALEKSRRVAFHLIQMGNFSSAEIANITELSLDEVNALRNPLR